MKSRLRYLFTLAIPVAALAGGTVWMLDLGSGSSGKLSYDTATVTRGSVRKVVSTSGPVRALVTVSIGSQLSGQIKDVNVDFNSEVKAGHLLATLDERRFAALVAQASSDLAAARAALLNQQAQLKKNEAILLQAGRATERQSALAARGFSAQSALDTAVRDGEVAKADIEIANAQIESARATIAQREAALDQAQFDLDRTKIFSPIEGTVISRTVDPGQTVAASLQAPELFKIAQDLRRIRIEAQVNEADVGAISQGNPATFTVDAYPDRQFAGTVTQVRLAATELDNVVTYTVIIEAANDDRRLFPGMTANVQIEAARRDDVLRVANEAFRFRPRDAASETATREKGPRRSTEERSQRQIERLKLALKLTPEQEQALTEALASLAAERRGQAQGAFGPESPERGQMRQLFVAKVEQVLAPMLTDAQRPLFANWKAGREATRPGTVWVLAAGNAPSRRVVQMTLVDDQFTAVASDQLQEGDRVIVRARETQP